MRIVGIPIIGRAVGDDGLECRGAASGDLEGVEPTPRYALHADGAAAPGLRSNPFDDFDAIILLLLHVLIDRLAFRIPRTANIDADTGISVTGIVGETHVVAGAGEEPRKIRTIVEDRGDRMFRRLRQPDAGREFHTVGHRDPGVFDLAEVVRSARRG